MRKVLPLFIMVLFGNMLFADQWIDKHHKYGTTPVEYEPVPAYVNPDYIDSYRNDVTITVGGGTWDSEISWVLDTDPAGDAPVASGGAPYSETATLPDGMYLLTADDAYNDGWNGGTFTITDNASGEVLYTYGGPPVGGAPENVSFEIGGAIAGCTDNTACNFNAEATEDDGSCCLTNCGDLTVGGGSFISEVSWEILDANGTVVLSDASGTPFAGETCMDDGVYTVNGFDSYGDGWNGNYFTLVDSYGYTVVNFTIETGSTGTTSFTLPYTPPANALVLAAVLDLTVPEAGSDGKAVVVQAFEDVDDLSLYGIGVANNGGGTDGQEYTFPAVPLDSGEVLWVIRSEAAYLNYFGAEMTNWVVDDGGSISQNGDDAIELFYDGTVVDLFGDPDTDGTGEAWEYLDAWAFRNCETRTPSTNFTLTDWTIAAPNCTDGSTTNADATCPFPTADLACTPAFECDLTHVQAYLQDSYGDGWNGNILDIAGGLVQLTLNNVDDDGAAAMFDLCLPDGYHPVTCGGGSWQTEVSWSLVNATSGETMLAGGAPFEGFLQVGEVTEVPGCTDPLAYGYDPDATVDDGSCYYDGDSCEVSLAAVEGDAGNAATGAEQWFSYTATLTGTMIATTCYPDQLEDTDVDVFVGASCDVATAVGASDDAGCGDVTGGNNFASEIEFDCVAGETYHFFWDDSWSPGPFTWYLYESPPPTNPQNLVALGGVDAAMLTWEGVPNPMTTSEIDINTYSTEQADIELEYYNQKKQSIHPETEEIHASGWVSPDYVGNTRQVVTIECDGGDWQDEVSWEILDATGAVVATGGAPAGTIDENGNYVPLTADLDGTYTLMAYDSYGDGWNGNLFTVSNETTTFLSWTLESGNEGSVEFTVADDVQLANLSLSNLMYDNATDMLSVDVTNDGGLAASGVGLSYHFTTELSAECNNAVAEFVFDVPFVGAGETVNFPVSGLAAFLGYGTYNVGHMVDYYCTVEESNEEDNTISGTIEIVDPFDGVTYNVYRALDEVAPAFSMLAQAVEEQMYVDQDVAPGDYVYYVTQVSMDSESDSSNYGYATVYGADDFPAPTDLMVEGNGYDAMLEWTAPDLSAWEPPAVMPMLPSNDEKLDDPSTYINYDPSDHPTPRQGGDTDADASVIDVLPTVIAGTTVGYTDDYDEACPYTGSISPDVVYSFTSAVDTFITVHTCSEANAYDTKLYVYEGAIGTLATTLSGDVACNDDFCENSSQLYLSYIEGVVINANTTYYIVVDGYGGASGSYELTVEGAEPPPPPPAIGGYVVYRDGEAVASTMGVESTMYTDEDLEDPANPGVPVTVSYQVAAFYDAFDIPGALSNEASVTLPVLNCYPPTGLMAETMSNNVHLEWESVPGQGGYFGHFNGEFMNAIGAGETPWEAGVLMAPEDLEDYVGMAMTKVAFIPNSLSQSFKVFVYDPATGLPVDSTEAIDGTTLILGQWHEVDLPNPVMIEASQPLMFGYRVIGLPDEFPAGCDTGPAVQGYGDLIKGFGADWQSMAYAYGFDYNWAIEGYAAFAPGRSLSSMEPVEVPLSVGNSSDLAVREMIDPISVSHPMSRSLLGYHVYRGDRHVGSVGPGELMFMDDWVPWGEYHYHVTAEYDHGVEGACSESEPAIVEVSLMNTPPGQVMLQTPADGSTFEVTVDENGEPDNLDTEVQFFWTQANDPDNDVVHYHVHALGHMEGDTLMEVEAPVMAQPNPSWEDNADTDTPLAPWGTWPPENTNFAFETQGNGIYNSDATLEVYDGEHCLKVWGQYGETMPNVTPVYQGHSVEALGLEPGDVVAIEGHMMSHADDWVGQGANRAYLFVSFFNADWGFLGSSLSHMMDRTMPPSEWHQFFALGVVPDGAVHMNAGVEYYQESGNDHGSVYFDDVNMFIPVTQSIMRVSYEDMVMEAMEDSVHHMTVDWNVMAMDVWDATPSSNGPFQFTMDLSSAFEELGVDGDLIPDVFALHNNYPNPFNPVTNITYDIPEVANVSLDIYNVMGQKVRTLVAGSHEPGRYRVLWNATNDFGEGLSSGMYIYKIQAGDFVSVKKLILMK